MAQILTTYAFRVSEHRVKIVSYTEARQNMETQYLLGDRANADFLLSGIEDMNAGRGEEHELIDPETTGSSGVA